MGSIEESMNEVLYEFSKKGGGDIVFEATQAVWSAIKDDPLVSTRGVTHLIKTLGGTKEAEDKAVQVFAAYNRMMASEGRGGSFVRQPVKDGYLSLRWCVAMTAIKQRINESMHCSGLSEVDMFPGLDKILDPPMDIKYFTKRLDWTRVLADYNSICPDSAYKPVDSIRITFHKHCHNPVPLHFFALDLLGDLPHYWAVKVESMRRLRKMAREGHQFPSSHEVGKAFNIIIPAIIKAAKKSTHDEWPMLSLYESFTSGALGLW